MAFGLYKPGQGYWVRVLTAAVAGVIALAASAWLWRTLQVIEPPIRSWQFTVRPAEGTAAAGQVLSLLGQPVAPGEPGPSLGTGVVESASVENGAATVTVAEIQLAGETTPASARSVAPGTGSAATLTGPVVGSPVARRAFDRMYIQASGVGVVIVLGSILIYWLVGSKPASSEFLIATDGEMKKVNWSTRKHIVDSTWVVIGYAVLLSIALFSVDTLFSTFFKLIRVLE